MGRIAALTAKEVIFHIQDHILSLDNKDKYFPIRGFFNFLLCFKDGTRVRFMDNYRRSKRVLIYGNSDFDTTPLNRRNEVYGDYDKMKSPERKAFVEYLKNHQYEECKGDNGFVWVQECGADENSTLAQFGGVQVNILTRKQVTII